MVLLVCRVVNAVITAMHCFHVMYLRCYHMHVAANVSSDFVNQLTNELEAINHYLKVALDALELLHVGRQSNYFYLIKKRRNLKKLLKMWKNCLRKSMKYSSTITLNTLCEIK